jgi:hypothetical protein
VFVDINDINGNYRFDDTAKGLTSAQVIHKELSSRRPHEHRGVVHASYRRWVEASAARLMPPDGRKALADSVLTRYPVHLQIQARAADAPAALQHLAEDVATQATLLTRKFTDGPIFPGAIASIRALRAHAAAHPELCVRHTLFTFGGDGEDTWQRIAAATGLALDGRGAFTGHTLVLDDGRTFDDPRAIYALLQTGNFVLTADFDYWKPQQAGKGKLIPVSTEPNVLIHFKDDNLHKAVAAPVEITAEGIAPVSVESLLDAGVVVDVDPVAFATDDGAFIRAINTAWRRHGWDLQLPEPAQPQQT